MKTAFGLALFGILLVSPAFAQSDDSRIRLSVGGALTAGAVDGEPAISASAGYRFAKNFSFEVEFTATDNSENRFDFPWYLAAGNFVSFDTGPARSGSVGPGLPNQTNIGVVQNLVRGLPPQFGFPIPIEGFDDEGSTLMTSAGFRFEFPVEGTRFRPYASIGMGLARTEQKLNFALATRTTPTVTVGPGNAVSSSIASSILPRFDDDLTHTGVMLSTGVGASLRVWQGLSIDLNARYFLLDRDRNLGSFGGGVSYRF